MAKKQPKVYAYLFYNDEKVHKGVLFDWPACAAKIKGVSGAKTQSFIIQGGDKESAILEAEVWCEVMEVEVLPIPPFNPEELGPDAVIAYTDGSNTGDASMSSWGVCITKGSVTLYEENGVITDSPYLSSRNIIGELKGAIRAVLWARENNTPVHIAFDYWGIQKWAEKKWKFRKDYARKYWEWMEEHKDYILGFHKVKGHTGIWGNERADQLAGEAIKRRGF